MSKLKVTARIGERESIVEYDGTLTVETRKDIIQTVLGVGNDSVNLNEVIRVTLTERGSDIMNDIPESYWESRKPFQIGDTLKMQLHEFCRLFGGYLYNGCEIPIEKNRIEIVS